MNLGGVGLSISVELRFKRIKVGYGWFGLGGLGWAGVGWDGMGSDRIG